ncbi:methyltransferase regulatory domain-containing protein [soil metagenome]
MAPTLPPKPRTRYAGAVSAEYVDDVPYVRHFVAELSPARIRLAAALNGIAPPPADDFDYCELGCAQADTLCALAAAHPRARFLGIDLSALHIAAAKRLARDGALENIGFLERDFANLDEEDIGEFDFIVAHGVLSWVSAEKRHRLIELARRKLKPGGLLYVSYNAMPGWAGVEPLRQLLLAPTAGEPASSLDRAKLGLQFAQAMERAGAEYFLRNPSAKDMLVTMERGGLPYVVHEYLHEHWVPMYFARIALEMAERELHFVGVLPLFLNFRDTAIPLPLVPMFEPIRDRVRFESLKDFALNEFFRRDVYVNGPVTRSAEATNAYLEGTAWGMLASAPPDDRTVRFRDRVLDFSGSPYDAILDSLAEGATTIGALAETRALASVGIEQLRAAIFKLAVGEAILPMMRSTRLVAAHGDDSYRVASPYNQMLLRRLTADTPLVMIAPICGTAFPLSALDALALRVLTEVPQWDRARWIRDLTARSVLRLRVGERMIEDPEAQVKAITTAVEQLVKLRLPKLLELGVLARGSFAP